MSLQKVTKALADPVRRQILDMLKKETLTAGDIQKEFMISFAAISRHLSVLKEANLIRDRREGKYIHYELNASVLEEVILWIYELRGNKNEKV